MAEAPQAALVRWGRSVWRPSSVLATQAPRALVGSRLGLRKQPVAAVQKLEEQPVVAPLVPPEPPIEAQQAAPEP